MSALAIQENLNTIPNEAKEHMAILSELLRDVDLEKRMMTLIKIEDFLIEPKNEVILQSIRTDLEVEMTKMRQMIFILEKAQYGLEIGQHQKVF